MSQTYDRRRVIHYDKSMLVYSNKTFPQLLYTGVEEETVMEIQTLM